MVLVALRRHPVRAERHQLDAVAPEGVLHPVPVHGLEVVQRRRLVEEVGVELRHLVARDAVRERARVAEDVRARGLRDRERPVGVVDQDQRDPPLLDRRLDRRVVVVRPGDRLVVAPGQVVLEGPVLRIQRLRRGRRRRCRHAETRGGYACRRHYCACSHLHPPSIGPAAPRSWNPHPSLRPRPQVIPCSLRLHEKSTKCGAISTACRVRGMSAKWTFMVYVAGYNNLSSFAAKDLTEMRKVGSSEDGQGRGLRQAGRAAGRAPDHRRQGRQERGAREPGRATSTPGSPQTLLDFIRWAKREGARGALRADDLEPRLGLGPARLRRALLAGQVGRRDPA